MTDGELIRRARTYLAARAAQELDHTDPALDLARTETHDALMMQMDIIGVKYEDREDAARIAAVLANLTPADASTQEPNTLYEIPATDARPGDRFTFIADETGERYAGTILARVTANDTAVLAQVRWDDGHESWTPLTVNKGKVEVYRRGEQDSTEVAIGTSGENHQEPPETVRERRNREGVEGTEAAD